MLLSRKNWCFFLAIVFQLNVGGDYDSLVVVVVDALALSSSSSSSASRPPRSTFSSSGSYSWTPPPNAQILSNDPLIYTIPNLLSLEECQAYQDYVEVLQEQGARAMTRSNPPEVSIDKSKLWPLPLLSLAAGIPSILKSSDTTGHWSSSIMSMDIIGAALLPVGIAFTLSTTLVIAAQPVVQAISNAQDRRTSVAMALNQKEDISFTRSFVDRIVQCSTGQYVDWDCWEAPVVTRYDPGAIFAKHGDASPTLGSEWEMEGGQRVITCICYLNDCPGGGGETYFDRLDLTVTPEPGKALVFFPADYDSRRADDRTTHESLPPLQDEKWIVQLFGRVGPRVPPPLGLPDEFGL